MNTIFPLIQGIQIYPCSVFYTVQALVIFVMGCTIWYHFWYNFTEINTLPWTFFKFFKLCKWYQIAQRITFRILSNIYDRAYLQKQLTLSRQRSLSYRNQSIVFHCKSTDWFLYYRGLRHERVNDFLALAVFTRELHQICLRRF